MRALDNPRLEAFATALARGLSVRAATEEAGFSRRHVGRMNDLAASGLVEARIREKRREALWGGRLELADVCDAMIAASSEARGLKTGAALMAAKELLAEAARLIERATIAPDGEAGLPPELTKEEWIAAFAPRT